MKKNKFKPEIIADIPQAKIFTEQHLNDTVWFQPLNEPIWHSATESQHMRAKDPILGVYVNNQAYALPWWIMKNHHVANLTLGEQPVLITLCEMCSSAGMFDRVINGTSHTFRLRGLYNGTHFISDFETGSFWTSFTGESIYGFWQGTVLERLPLFQLEWQEWIKIHPDTLVLYGSQELREGHGSNDSPGSGGIGSKFAESLVKPIDGRLPYNTLVLGVKVNNSAKAYPLVELDKYGAVITDTISNQQIVIFHQPKSLLALAFSPQLEAETLEFELTAEGKISDKNTGSLWNYTGEAYQGKLKGSQLRYIYSGIEEWYIWAAHNPETEIFNNVGGLRFKLANTIPGIGKLFG